MDRSLDRIMELLHRAQRLETNRRGLGAVATWDDRLCGFGMLTLWPRAAEISDLFVNAAYRGRGIGTSLIRYLTEAARELNVGTLEIGVALSNPHALALYRRLGFVDERTIEIDLGQGPEPVLYLQKYLEPHAFR
jgi:ribosomal protein S18 acetylase RimI-like enzyme